MPVCFCTSRDTARITITTVEKGIEVVESKNPPLCITTHGAGNLITYGSHWIRPANHPDNFDFIPNNVSWDGNCNTLLGGGKCQAHLSGANAPQPFFDGEGTCQLTIKPTNGGCIITDAAGMLLKIESAHPITFQGSCNSDCPDGYCKIDCPEYPGYCCINCDEISSLFLNLNK